jgi:hypothetical protein
MPATGKAGQATDSIFPRFIQSAKKEFWYFFGKWLK